MKELKKCKSETGLKILFSLIAISAIVARLIWPDLKVDAITLGLFVLALLPWFSEMIETLKVPGGWEVTFRDLQKAGDLVDKVADKQTSPPFSPSSVSTSLIQSEEPAYIIVADKNTNLALAELRIEIEKRLRILARKYRLPGRISLMQTLRLLQQRQVLTSTSLTGLKEIISAGNQAVHGARIEPKVANWAISNGPIVLSALDNIASDYEQGEESMSMHYKDYEQGEESMSMHYMELDEKTRATMLSEFDAEQAGGNPYRSKALSPRGQQVFPQLMRDAIEKGTEVSLASALADERLWNPMETYVLKGISRERMRNVRQSAERLAITEFSTWYVHGLAKRLLDEGVKNCQIYRGAPAKWEPGECAEHEGRIVDVKSIYDSHRARYWPEPGDKTAFSIPVGPGCHHLIKRV